MIRHIVIWDFKDEFTAEQNRQNAQRIKSELEALPKVIDGIVDLHVEIDLLPSSSGSAALISLFKDEAALAAYQAHPEHQKVRTFVHSVKKSRKCVDYIE